MPNTLGVVAFPGAQDDSISLLNTINNAPDTTVSGTVLVGDTTITVASTTGYAATNGSITIDGEIIYYSGVTSTTFTSCLRGQDGTTAAGHSIGANVHGYAIQSHRQLLRDGLINAETALITQGNIYNVVTSASAAATATSGTITTSGVGIARVSPTTAITSVILQAGTFDGQRVVVRNEATYANSISFAADATSNILVAIQVQIDGGTQIEFVWSSALSRWVANIPLSGLLASTVAASGAINTTGEQAFSQSFLFPANTLLVGKTIRVFVSGITSSTSATPTQTIKVRFLNGSSVSVYCLTGSAIALINGTASWIAECFITVRTTGATGTFWAQGYVDQVGALPAATAARMAGLSAAATFDTTITETLQVTATLSVTTGSPSATMQQFIVDILN